MSFENLVRPRSIAVIGASSNPIKVGNNIISNLISGGFAGDIYPVNPGATEILGKKCYASVKDIPGPVDCAVITIPRAHRCRCLKMESRRNLREGIL